MDQHRREVLDESNERVDGSIEQMTATDWAEMDIGDRFVIETPGGGGFGRGGA